MKVERNAASSDVVPAKAADTRSPSLDSLRDDVHAAYDRRAASGRDRRRYFAFEDSRHLLRIQQRHRLTLAELRRVAITALAGRTVLDLGCGDGDGVVDAIRWGADPERIVGVDLRPEALAAARDRSPTTRWVEACGTALPFERDAFDLVFLSTVLSSVTDPDSRSALAAEVERILRPNGFVVIYDMVRTNPRNPDVVSIDRSELDRLFPKFTGRTRRLTFAPHWARRWPSALLEWTYPLLASLPLLCTHQLSVLGPIASEQGAR